MSLTSDRRADLKVRHRQAIVAAAASLMDDHGSYRFTVDQLAERADVSRRTVFNHFASLDDVVAQVCADLLADTGVALEAAVVDGPGPRPADDLGSALDQVDLVVPMVRLHRAIGLGGDWKTRMTPQQENLLLRSFSQLALGIDRALRRKYPDIDPVDISLLLGSSMGGLIALHRHWLLRTGSRDDPEARALWADLLTRLRRLGDLT